MRIITYNVNGIRAAMNKGLMDWLGSAKPDVFLVQETKAMAEQVDRLAIEEAGYRDFWHSAEKKGYSGVAILSRMDPDHIEVGCGIDYIDREGRIIRADFGDISVMSVYIPSGSSGDMRQDLKMTFLDDFLDYITELRKERPQLIIGGDFNICHEAIDIHDPVRNKTVSGFLPEEREWVTNFLSSGFVDSFRHFNKDPHFYSWWSYRANARANNKGWRIDYNMVTENLKERMQRAVILSEAVHSDHCPVMLEIK
jgi:exodeoxyribonuclease-3